MLVLVKENYRALNNFSNISRDFSIADLTTVVKMDIFGILSPIFKTCVPKVDTGRNLKFLFVEGYI